MQRLESGQSQPADFESSSNLKISESITTAKGGMAETAQGEVTNTNTTNSEGIMTDEAQLQKGHVDGTNKEGSKPEETAKRKASKDTTVEQPAPKRVRKYVEPIIRQFSRAFTY